MKSILYLFNKTKKGNIKMNGIKKTKLKMIVKLMKIRRMLDDERSKNVFILSKEEYEELYNASKELKKVITKLENNDN